MQSHGKENSENPYRIYYEDYLDTNACTECTGLIPGEAADGEEWEAYREIFNFLPHPPACGENAEEH